MTVLQALAVMENLVADGADITTQVYFCPRCRRYYWVSWVHTTTTGSVFFTKFFRPGDALVLASKLRGEPIISDPCRDSKRCGRRRGRRSAGERP